MVRGLYEAASGVLAQLKSFSVTANNIANVGTSGFKAVGVVGSSFAEHYVARIGDGNIFPSRNIGKGSFFTVNISEYTDFTQGSIENTGRELDMAINGNGYFRVHSDSMGDVLTRNGQFDVDSEMQLILPGVGVVLDDGGSPIILESSTFP
ncbi:MAG: flagellar hook-basal body complex protein [Oscillospiraceae bacterium]|nr:flagellar hook-basal body complex protein [Oscillospiraceae bacterium]